jgi:hypothetical protein
MSFALDPTASLIAAKPFPSKFAKSPQAVSSWIDGVVPCLAAGATQSQTVTDAVIDHLRSQGVSEDTIAAGLVLNSYRFAFSWRASSIGNKVAIALMPQPSRSGLPPAPQMHSISPGDVRASNINAARILDARYKGAMMSGNSALMRAILSALIDILVAIKGGDASFNQTKEDKERIEEQQREILVNAEAARRALRRGSGPGGNGEWEIDEDMIEEDIESAEGEGEAE